MAEIQPLSTITIFVIGRLGIGDRPVMPREKSWRSPIDRGLVLGNRWNIHDPNDPQLDLAKLGILIVEDGTYMRHLLTEVLGSLGCQNVCITRNGKDALAALGRHKPDVVITDWLMSPIDGFELTQRLRSEDFNPNPFVPIIMLTGFTRPHLVCKARNLGVTELLAKPVSVNSLYGRIRHVVLHPRSFVKAETFFGPDRRRLKIDIHAGPNRRNSSEPAPETQSPAEATKTAAAPEGAAPAAPHAEPHAEAPVATVASGPRLIWSRTEDADHRGWKRWRFPVD